MIPTGGFLQYTSNSTIENFFSPFTKHEFAEMAAKHGLQHGSLMGKTALHSSFIISSYQQSQIGLRLTSRLPNSANIRLVTHHDSSMQCCIHHLLYFLKKSKRFINDNQTIAWYNENQYKLYNNHDEH